MASSLSCHWFSFFRKLSQQSVLEDLDSLDSFCLEIKRTLQGAPCMVIFLLSASNVSAWFPNDQLETESSTLLIYSITLYCNWAISFNYFDTIPVVYLQYWMALFFRPFYMELKLCLHLRFVHTDCGNGNGNSNILSIKNGLHWALWKSAHGDLRQGQWQTTGQIQSILSIAVAAVSVNVPCVNVNICVKFCIEWMVMQTHVQRMGSYPFSASP